MARRRHSYRRTPGVVRGGIMRERPSVLFGGARRRPLAVPPGVIFALAAAFALIVAALLVFVVRPAFGAPAGVVEVQRAPETWTPEAFSFISAAAARAAQAAQAQAAPEESAGRFEPVQWRAGRAVGQPHAGRLVDGTQLPAEGLDWFTWDWKLERSPNRGFRRWGTDELVRTVIMTLAEYRHADPAAPRVGVADLSRTRGGEFGPRFGGVGHLSHQNGTDVDILMPRKDGQPLAPTRPEQVDRARAQALADRFVAAGAERVFVGENVRLTGPRDVVAALPHHDDHLHVRIRPPR